MIQDRFQQRIIEQVVNVQAQPKSSRKRCRERIQWSECEIKQMTKHIVHSVKEEQQMIIQIAVQRKESVQGSSDHASLVHRGGLVKETKQFAKHTESPERQHIDKVMCQLCYTGRIQQSKPSRKTVWSYQAAKHRQSCRQLRELAEVSADGAENRRRSTSTPERRVR